MSTFDSILIVDWSGGNDRGATPKKDAIWVGGTGLDPTYFRNRQRAEEWLSTRIATAISSSERILIGFDFPFGLPRGFAQRVTGKPDPFAFWDWLEVEVKDTPKQNNRWEIAGKINRMFPGVGPFWGNGGKADVLDLPRKGTARRDHGMPEKRQVEDAAPRAFPVWQLAGAGSVGSQMLMGLPVLARLRRQFASDISIWPFEPANGQVVLAEVWPSLLNDLVKEIMGPEDIRDAVQVKLTASAFHAAPPGVLSKMLSVQNAEEGWILGLGFEDELRAGLLHPKPPPLSNDCFALPPGVDWTPVDEALSLLKERLSPVVATKTVPIGDATGKVLAEEITASRANPPKPNAAVDGYGFAHAASGDGDQLLPLVNGRAAAGQPFSGSVPSGRAIRILTGAQLPDGVDTIVLDEDCEATATAVAFRGPVKIGANTRAAGEDFQHGDTIAAPGLRLRAPDIAMLAAAGYGEVPVFAPLKVAVLSTGDELVAPGDPRDGTVDANFPMLDALLRGWGYEVVNLGRAADRPDVVREALNTGARDADVIITSGGASAGDEDHVSAILRAEGNLTAWRIALKPGRPLAMAMWEGTPVFGLPGNPVAALVCTLIFARPALSVLAGGHWIEPLRMQVPAAFRKRKKPGRNEYLRARLTADGRAEVFQSEGSGRISGLAWAEGLVEIGSEAREITPGDLVTFLPYAGMGV